MRPTPLSAIAVLGLIVGQATAQDLDGVDLGGSAKPPRLSDRAVEFLAKGFDLTTEQVRERYAARIESALQSATGERPDSRPMAAVLAELVSRIGTRPGGPFDDLQTRLVEEASRDKGKDPTWSALLKHVYWTYELVNPLEKELTYPKGEPFEEFRKELLKKFDEMKERQAQFNLTVDAAAGEGPDRDAALEKLKSYDRKVIERWIQKIEPGDKERAEKTRKAFARVWGDRAEPAPPPRPRAPGGGEHYALLVAVADYDKKELRPLKFTRSDVLAMYSQLLDSGYKPENIILMHDDLKGLVAHYEKLGADFNPRDYLPEGGKIRRELRLLLGRLLPADSLVVAFAGHGIEFRVAEKSYFCPVDARLGDRDSLIAFTDLYAELKRCKADRKLLLVDACQDEPQSELSRSRATVDLESVTRPQTEPVPKGIVAFFSCTAGQKSFEDPELGHGIFFFHLLQGWKGTADLDGDGQLSYLELAAYTARSTSDYAARRLKTLQTPELKAEFSGEWILRSVPRRQIP